jgi:hypothetical protein
LNFELSAFLNEPRANSSINLWKYQVALGSESYTMIYKSI